MMHRMHSLSELADKLATLSAGETLVAVVGCEEGHYLCIGNTLTHRVGQLRHVNGGAYLA